MSRGYGTVQQAVLKALEESPMVSLRGSTRSETNAKVRAARSLERQGKCVLVRLWNDAHTQAYLVAFRPGYVLRDGRKVESLSVATVQGGTDATLTGSLRNLARQVGVSKTTVARDLERAVRTSL